MVAKIFSGGEGLDAYLADLAKKVTQPATLQVGFPEGATYPDGLPVAAVAAFNEYGAPSHNQPPRPFFRTMIAKESPHWGDDVAGALKHTDYDAKRALELVGEEIKAELQESIVQFRIPGNAESTIARKGFDKPLIGGGVVGGFMLQSVKSTVKT